jgi:hypothetical protein
MERPSRVCYQPSKLAMRVRFLSLAPAHWLFSICCSPSCYLMGPAGTVASDTGLFPFTGTSLDVQDFISTVALLPNGQALAIGSHTLVRATGTTAATIEFAFARVNPDGTLDSSFGTGGTALTSVDFTSGGFGALFPQSDGTAIAVGEGTLSSGQSGLVIARFNL